MGEASKFLARFDAMDRALVVAGFPATSPWWRAQIDRFLRSGRRRWVIRAGRRAGKSSTLCRLAVAWALWGTWSVPPGDTAVIPFVSIDREEASARIRTIRDILTALGAKFTERSEELELHDRRVVFRVTTCSVRSVGFTAIALFADEMSRWESRDTAANPAREVMGSIRPTLATQPNAFEVCSSSPWSTDDYHATLFDDGDTPHQVTSFAPTWIANPTLTEERTHELEPDPRVWSREYAAEPGGTVTDGWLGVAIERAVSDIAPPPIEPGIRPFIAIDPAFARDSFGYAVLTTRASEPSTPIEKPRRMTYVHEVGAWRPGSMTPTDCMRRLKKDVCDRFYGPREFAHVLSDQFEGFSLKEIARAAGINLEVIPWVGGSGPTSKSARFTAVRTAMLEGAFRIPNDPALIKELGSVRAILSPSGNERIEIPRIAGNHGDRTSALVLGGSVALSRSPSEAEKPKTELTEMQKYRAARVRAHELQYRRAWTNNPQGMMRRIFSR